jgi:hypothetical protein
MSSGFLKLGVADDTVGSAAAVHDAAPAAVMSRPAMSGTKGGAYGMTTGESAARDDVRNRL